MIVYTDSINYSDKVIDVHESWQQEDISSFAPNLKQLVKKLYRGQSIQKSKCVSKSRWTQAFIIHHAPSSHYDLLIDLSQKGIVLQDRIICLAGSGKKFHGQRNRHWVASEGNIHLTIFLAPNKKIAHFQVGFITLAAASLIETIDALESFHGKANIKWVNDVLINDAKIAGSLVHTMSIEDTVAIAVLGIGLNVETIPEVPPDLFAPKVASLRSFAEDPSCCKLKKVLKLLLLRISENYDLLLAGYYDRLLDIYRRRSLVVGRNVKILSDRTNGLKEEIASGRVTGIGDNLELILEGKEKPVTRGRLILKK